MAIKKELIQFTISNQTDCKINLPLFQQNVYSVNATTKYSWNITSETLSCGTGTIVVNGNTLNLTFAPTLSGLLNALNALGFGFFCTETSGGNTFLYVVDDTNVYGGLDLCPSATTTTTTTTSTTTAAPTTTTTTTSTTAVFYQVDVLVSELTNTGLTIKLWYSTNGGATWTFYTNGTAGDYPNYNVFSGIQFPAGTNVLFGITDNSDGNIQYGSGFSSGDFNSLCGLSNPFVINNISASTILYANLNVSGGNFVPCTATTTTTTTSTTTAAPTTTTSTTSTTTAASTTTTTTTSTTTAAPNLTITNSSSGVISNITGFSYTIISGSFPLNSGGLISASHSGSSGTISVTLSSAPSNGNLTFANVTTSVQECISVTAAGTYTTSTFTFASTDNVTIAVGNAPC